MILLSLDEVTSIKTGSHIPKEFQWKTFEKDEKCFSFHVKNTFRSQDI